MAKIKELEIKTGDAIKNIKDLKNNIAAYKAELEKLTIGEKDYKDTLVLLQQNQAALRNAMHGTTASMKDVMNAATGANIEFDANNQLVKAETLSYNELVKKLADLKQEWRSTADASTRAELGEKVNAVNNQLKKLDASVGVYGRNVGSYKNVVDQLGNSLNGLGGAMPSVINGVKGVTMGFKALSATPALGVLQILLPLISGLVSGLKSSEEGLESASAAMGIFSGISNAVTSAVQSVAQGLGWLSKQFVNLLDKLGLVNERMKENQAIAAEEIRVARQQRDAIKANADAEKEVAELRAKAVNKDKYSAKERIAFLEQANAKEMEISERAKKAAKDEYDLIVRKNRQTQSGPAELKAEAEAYAKMVQAETNYNNKSRELISQMVAFRKEAATEAKNRAKEKADAEKAGMELEKSIMEQELTLLAAGSEERLAKEKEIRAKEYEIAKLAAKAKIKNQEDLDKQLKLLKDIYDADILKMDKDFQDEQVEQALQVEKNRVEVLTKGTEEYYRQMIALRQTELDTLEQMDGESDAAYQARVIAAQNAHKEAVLAFAQWKEDQAHLERENELAALEEGTFAYMEKEIELKQYELDTLHKLESESEAEFQARRLAKQKEVEQTEKAHFGVMVSMAQDYAGGLTGIMSSIADIMESGTEVSEKEAKRAKNLRTASAIIDTISGAVAAYMNAVKSVPDPIAGPIMGAIQAAAVTAAGMANVAKIRSTNVNADSSGGSASTTTSAIVSAPTVTPEVTQVRSVTGASEEDRLNQMASSQRVYILSSDIEASNNARRVQVAETTF